MKTLAPALASLAVGLLGACQPVPASLEPAQPTPERGPDAQPTEQGVDEPKPEPVSAAEVAALTQQLRDGYVEACADEQPVSRQPVGAVTDRFDRDMMHYSQLRQALSGFPEGHRSLEGVWERTFEVWDEPPRLPSLWCGVPREERWPCVAPVTQEHRANRERFLARDELLRLAVRPPDRAYALEERLQSVQWTDQTLGCGDRVGFHLGVTRGEDGVAQLVTLDVRAGKLKPEENPS